MLHETTTTTAHANGKPASPRQPDRQPNGAAYKHILVPTNLSPRDRPAVTLGLQMAAAHQAKITVLHVLPSSPPPPSLHWLDAIDNLHQRLSRPNKALTEDGDVAAIETSCREVCEFLSREVNLDMRVAPHVRAECRIGDIEREILRFADEAGVDLVILCCEMSAGMSRRVLRVMQSTQKQVVLVRPSVSDRAAHAAPIASRNGN